MSLAAAAWRDDSDISDASISTSDAHSDSDSDSDFPAPPLALSRVMHGDATLPLATTTAAALSATVRVPQQSSLEASPPHSRSSSARTSSSLAGTIVAAASSPQPTASRPATRGSAGSPVAAAASAASSADFTAAATSSAASPAPSDADADAGADAGGLSPLKVAGSPLAPLAPRPPLASSKRPRASPKRHRQARRPSAAQLAAQHAAAAAEAEAEAAAEAEADALFAAEEAADLARVAAAKPSFVAGLHEQALALGQSSLLDGVVPGDGTVQPSRRSRASRLAAPPPLPCAVPTTVAPAVIDHEEAAQAPLGQILSRRFRRPTTAEQKRPDHQRRMGHELPTHLSSGESDDNEAAEEEEKQRGASPPAPAPEAQPYHLQGNPHLYHPLILLQRESLQYHPGVSLWSKRFWDTFAHHQTPGRMGFGEYANWHIRVCRVLYGPPPPTTATTTGAGSSTAGAGAGSADGWDRDAALKLCKLDWRRDTRALPGAALALAAPASSSSTGSSGSPGSGASEQARAVLISYPHFARSLFELVDLWTTTVDPAEYEDFLAVLYARVMALTPADLTPASAAKGGARAREQPQQTRHHADPAHQHNITAEERRRRAAAAAAAETDADAPDTIDLLGAAPPPSDNDSLRPVDEGTEAPGDNGSNGGGEDPWGGFSFLGAYGDGHDTNVAQIRERKRARAEALARQARGGGAGGGGEDDPALEALRAEDERRRLHADGSVDSGTSRILPLIDHLASRNAAAAAAAHDDEADSLEMRFPPPDFAALRARAEAEAKARALVEAAEAAEAERLAQEEEAAFALASSRAAVDLPPSDEAKEARRAERAAAKEAATKQAEADRLAAAAAAAAAASATYTATEEEAAEKAARDLMPSSSESSSDEKARSPSPPPRRPAKDPSSGVASLKQPTGRFVPVVRKSLMVVRPSAELVAARQRRYNAPMHRGALNGAGDAAFAAAVAARQEESRRALLEKAVAARRQVRVKRALAMAQRRLAEVQSLEARRLAEASEKAERERDFFRHLDESIATADPSYVPPPLPPGSGSGLPRRREDELDAGEKKPLEALTEENESDEAAAAGAGGSPGKAPGYRTRSITVPPRSRPHGPPLHSPTSPSSRRRMDAPGSGGSGGLRVGEFELEKLRADRLRIEEQKRAHRAEQLAALQANMERDALLAALSEGEEAGGSDAEEDASEESLRRRARRASVAHALGLAANLAPLDDQGAYEEYTPQLQMQLAAEIEKLSALDAQLGKFGAGAGAGAEAAFRPWEREGKKGQKLPPSDPPRQLSAAEQSEARSVLVAAAGRLRFLRAKVSLSRRSGMENREESRELAALEARLEGRVGRSGEVLETSFLALAREGLREADEVGPTGSRYTGFRVNSLRGPLQSQSSQSQQQGSHSREASSSFDNLSASQAAKLSGDSRFWALRQRLAKRRVLKYSAMAILAEQAEHDAAEGGAAGGGGGGGVAERQVLLMKLGAPASQSSWQSSSTAALGQRSRVISYKRTAIQRVLDEAAKLAQRERAVRNLGEPPGATSARAGGVQSDDEEQRDDEQEQRELGRSASQPLQEHSRAEQPQPQPHALHAPPAAVASLSSAASHGLGSSRSAMLYPLLHAATATTATAASSSSPSTEDQSGLAVGKDPSRTGVNFTSRLVECNSDSVLAMRTTSAGTDGERRAMFAMHRRALAASKALARARRQSQPATTPMQTQAELEWAKEQGVRDAFEQAARATGAHATGQLVRGQAGYTLPLALSARNAPPLNSPPKKSVMRGSATARLPQRRSAFAPPLPGSQTARSNAPVLGVVAFAV